MIKPRVIYFVLSGEFCISWARYLSPRETFRPDVLGLNNCHLSRRGLQSALIGNRHPDTYRTLFTSRVRVPPAVTLKTLKNEMRA